MPAIQRLTSGYRWFAPHLRATFGYLLGAALITLVPLFPVQAAWTETVLYSFCSAAGCTDGAHPNGDLIADAAGSLYGTTDDGGNPHNGGTVFKLARPTTPGGDWTLTTLYTFCSAPGCSDGSFPGGGLTFGAGGVLFGTAYSGGAGNGAVYMLTPPASPGAVWTETVLHTFTGTNGDGAGPGTDTLLDESGALFGTTQYGGRGNGTVFRLTPPALPRDAWQHETIYQFRGANDGIRPMSSLVADKAGNLYGTTYSGGSGFGGTVFMLSKPAPGGAWVESVLRSFISATDGCCPLAGLTIDSKGVLFGTAGHGGFPSGNGTVFSLTPPAQPGSGWVYAVLHTFDSSHGGNTPIGGVTLDCLGVLLGTTAAGGNRGSPCEDPNGCGVAFRLRPPVPPGTLGAFREVYRFTGGADGARPEAACCGARGGRSSARHT
jgi:hypothetical protein